MPLAQVDWGSVPDWFSGVGSATALVFAFLAVRVADRTNVSQSRQLATLEQDRRQAQASKVAAWCTGDRGEVPTCRIRNASDLPIFGVIVCVVCTDLRPGPHPRWWRYQQLDPHVMAPGTVDVALDASGLSADAVLYSRRSSVALYFGDAQGRWWRRTVRGLLVEQPFDPAAFGRVLAAGTDVWAPVPARATESDPVRERLTERS